jgi:hypothetical protein
VKRSKPVSNTLIALGMLIGFLTAAGAGVSINLAAGCTGHQRQDTLRASLVVLDGARDGFLDWLQRFDKQKQDEIVASATSAEDAKAKTAAFRQKRDEIIALFPVAYHAIALASLHDDDKSFDDALKAGKTLLKDIEDLKGAK